MLTILSEKPSFVKKWLHGLLPLLSMAKGFILPGVIVALSACSLLPRQQPPKPPIEDSRIANHPPHPTSLWQAAKWEDLPGWENDDWSTAWQAWLHSCEKPAPIVGHWCGWVRQHLLSDTQEQRRQMMQHFVPYRVLESDGRTPPGLLTAYYEPQFLARRTPNSIYRYPIHQLPLDWQPRQPWFTRQEIATLPQAQTALRGREIAWLADPIDLLLLHIQGSGRLEIQDDHRSTRQKSIRVAYAGSNGQPYRSIFHNTAEQRIPRLSWPQGVKEWAQQNPQQVDALLWNNPRYIFFREEPLNAFNTQFGPKGAQGVPLTAGRSIAVDRNSIPYGTPVWLHSPGPSLTLQRLVMAQDTGSAITGAVRADYFVGWDENALSIAATIKQPLEMWVLWPREARPPKGSSSHLPRPPPY